MKKEDLIKKAKNDLNVALENSTIQELENAKIGYGISASKFARRYADPLKDNETYKVIYDYYCDIFESMKITTLSHLQEQIK